MIFIVCITKLHDPQIRAALGLSQVDEALLLQQHRELQRDFHLRQLLLQDQLNQQSQLDSIVAEQRMKQAREQLRDFPDLQAHYAQLLLQDRLQRGHEESSLFARAQLQKHEELQRQALALAQQHPPVGQQQQLGGKAQESPGKGAAHAILRDIAADSLAGNAVKRSELEKRVFANSDESAKVVVAPAKKRPRAGTEDSGDGDRKKKKKKDKPPKSPKKASVTVSALAELGRAASEAPKQPTGMLKTPVAIKKPAKLGSPNQTTMKPSAQALLDFAGSGEGHTATPMQAITMTSPNVSPHGTLTDLLQAAESEQKTDDAASVLAKIKARTESVEWSDSETDDDDDDDERKRAVKRGDAIILPNFTSVLPQLPEEPEVLVSTPSRPSKKKRKRHKSLMDDDSVDAMSNNKAKDEKDEEKLSPGQKKSTETAVLDYPYPIDTWWPQISQIRKERKENGESVVEEDNFEDEEEPIFEPAVPFRANMPTIKERLAHQVKPGVLEKVPHCRIHRNLKMKPQFKYTTCPDLVQCFQVTELYPNAIMVCCSHCGTWRHTECGGHYKPYSVRECIDTPFTAICDRCHAEEKILRDHPVAKKRIDRQRAEQIRRGLATSAAMRQASFSKHGGTYKWPLGSVSATHIGGHTRSVHTRHEKAEKQWAEMATRLARTRFSRIKDQIKVRTKELERLLVSVEDAGKTMASVVNLVLFLPAGDLTNLQRVIRIDTT